MANQAGVPAAFFWRRIHSLTGLWVVIFLLEHLLTNSQAALWITDDGSGFVRAVNFIQSLPYLHAIEVGLLALPIGLHMVWGVRYLFTSKANSFPTDGSAPSLTQYYRNHAYTWQRITSWILVVAIIAHVVQMRFINYPESARLGNEKYYMVRVGLDSGLPTVADRLNVRLLDGDAVGAFDPTSAFALAPLGGDAEETAPVKQQREAQAARFVAVLQEQQLRKEEVVAIAPDFGTATLLVVRETFKMPLMLVLYTLFVLAAVFHAFNGLWTFMISWGVTLTPRSQTLMRTLSTALMLLFGFLGLAAIWGTYLVTLKS